MKRPLRLIVDELDEPEEEEEEEKCGSCNSSDNSCPDDEGDADVDPDADWCAEVSWTRAAAIVRENDWLMNCPDRVEAMEKWVRSVVAPRWWKSVSKAALSDRDYNVLSAVVRRVSTCSHLMRLRLMPRFRPAFQFVMKHPQHANPNVARSVMIKLDPPVRWVEATRDPNGVLCYRRDGGRVPIDMMALTPASYGNTWAEAVAPSRGTPVFLPPDRVDSLAEEDRHWYVFSAGVDAWVPARPSSRDGSDEWVQKFPDPPCRVEYPILDVGSELGDEKYGRDVGALAPLYDGDLSRVYDRLVLHPQYQAKWIGVYQRDGRFFAYSYPDDVEVEVDLRPENFNKTWCWPPCLVE